MKLYKAALLSSLIGCATLGQAVAETPAYAAKNSTITMSLTPTEEVGEDEHEETQGECILWPGCIVLPSSQSPQN